MIIAGMRSSALQNRRTNRLTRSIGNCLYYCSPGWCFRYGISLCAVGLLAMLLSVPAAAQPVETTSLLPCPDLSGYYQLSDWVAVEQQLSSLMPRCLQSSEYFALLGAAQMNNQNLSAALTSLERALLIAPENGAAQVDYAQALYLQGQLFSAIEMNQQLMGRSDLPPGLGVILKERNQEWLSQTRQWEVRGDILQGYDDNLNGAPGANEITLTLPDDSIIFPLDPDSKPIHGPYTNLRAGMRYRQLTPEYQHNVMLEARGRVSEDEASDYLQIDGRYGLARPSESHSWQVNTGLSSLMFGGRPLYTTASIGGSYLPDYRWNDCRPYIDGASQFQRFHDQTYLNALESQVGVGLNCVLGKTGARHQFVTEMSYIDNRASQSGRPGGDRMGWQLNLEWRRRLADQGVLSARFNHTRIKDQRGYNPLLERGARRDLERSYGLIQYQRPFMPNTRFLVNLFYQYQGSNLNLFQSRDSSVEFGISHTF